VICLTSITRTPFIIYTQYYYELPSVALRNIKEILQSPYGRFLDFSKMTCVFCRERNHSKSDCTHPNTVAVQRAVLELVMTTYNAGLTRSLTLQEYTEANIIVLDRKFTVVDLNKALEYLKKRVNTRYTYANNKRTLISIITRLSCQLFNYTFSTFANSLEHTLNENRLTPGISSVVNEVLHPRVGGLQPHTPPQTQRNATIPVPQYRILIRPSFQTPTPRTPYIQPVNLHTTFQRESVQQPPTPPTPVYTVHKTEIPFQTSSSCPICFDDLDNKTYVYLNCSHEFCKKCIKECIRTRHVKCSLCRTNITDIYTQEPVVTYSI